MKKTALCTLFAVLVLNLYAQFPFSQGVNFSKVYVDTKMSIGVSYASTSAMLHIKGSGTTTSTYPLYITDNSGNLHLFQDDGGQTMIRTGTNYRYLFTSGQLSFTDDAGTIRAQTITGSTLTWNYMRFITSNLTLNPSATSTAFWVQATPSGNDVSATGSNTLRVYDIKPTWNLSASSTCDVVGWDYNPTVTEIHGNHYAALFRLGSVGIGTATPTSTFTTVGSNAKSITTVTSNTTAGEHYTILVDCTSGAVTITLPAVSGCDGRIYVIKKIDSSGNAVTIDGDSSETIDGATTKTISNQWAYYSVQATSTGWYIVANN